MNFKNLFIATLLIGGFALTSCSKEKTCECTTSSDMIGIDDIVTTVTIDEGDCSDGNSTTTTNGITASVNCVEQ